MDISSLKIKDLSELIDRARVRIEELKKSEAADVRAKLIAMAKDHGFDAMALLSGKAGAVASPAGDKVRRPAKAKYADPNSGATWTGRGLKPRWLKEALEKGASQDSFLI